MAREKSCVKRSTEGSCSADGSSAFGIEEALAKRELTFIFRIGGSGGGKSCGNRALVFSLKSQHHFNGFILIENVVYPCSITLLK
jgi:hypothetical protein